MLPHAPRPPGRSRGFTLVEMAVALVLLGLGLAVVAPSLPRPRTGAETAARQLRGVLAEGRRLAALHGGEARVTLDVRGGAYRLHLRPGGSGADSLVRSGRLEGWTAPRGGERSDSLLVVRVDALGRSGAEGRSAGVAVNPWTGRAHVELR